MEYIYYLNFDCISNFELAQYYVYFQILLTVKILFSRFHDVTKLNLLHDRDSLTICPEKLDIFPHLTYLCVCKQLKYINYQPYIESYIKKYNRFPLLQTLNTHCEFSTKSFKDLIHLRSLKQTIGSTSSKYLNDHSKLTSLTFLIPLDETLLNYTTLNDLKILHIKKHHHVSIFSKYDYFSCLEKLTINFKWINTTIPITIACSRLTYLSVKNISISNGYVNLDMSMKLKYLELNSIYFDNLNLYLEKVSTIRTLKIHHVNKCGYITLSKKSHPNLKHLILHNIDCFMMDGKMELETYVID